MFLLRSRIVWLFPDEIDNRWGVYIEMENILVIFDEIVNILGVSVEKENSWVLLVRWRIGSVFLVRIRSVWSFWMNRE